MSTPHPTETVADIARLLAARVRWEMEHGTIGYLATEVSLKDTDVRATPMSASLTAPPPKPPISRPVPSAASAPVTPSLSAAAQTPSAPPSTSPRDEPRPANNNAEPDAANAQAQALEALRAAIGDCTRCVLHTGRTQLVFGEGNPNARLVFVGEGPGRDEDLAGRPFVGAAGQLLDRIITAMGLSREEVYICNIVKCRPPGNRTPEPLERRICGPFVMRQLAVIRPEAVVALGATAAAYLLDTEAPIGRLRGRFHQKENLKIMPTFHPAFLLRNPGAKRDVWHDMQQVMALLGINA